MIDPSQDSTNNDINTSKLPEVKLVAEARPLASPVAQNQDAVHTVTIFTTEEKPLPSPVEV